MAMKVGAPVIGLNDSGGARYTKYGRMTARLMNVTCLFCCCDLYVEIKLTSRPVNSNNAFMNILTK